ncbi:glycosyltransferase family 2 protein [Desulfovibrio sp. OttesenSCG-928-C06]|nr:glycosyltransferase family 2 protein [Desulfovibrio sp. OttesenSCG-928-C06]
MQTPLVSIIIPVFNKWELTRACLESLREHTPQDVEIIVVDNASADATASELAPLGQALFGGRFCAIRNADNINFGPACNLGAQQAGAPLLLFLNNDTILTPNWLPPLINALEQPGVGAVGPLLLYADRTVQHLGITFSITGKVSHLYNGFPEKHPAVKRKRKLQAITAAVLLLRKDLFFEAGAFYPGYRNGFEDLELCARIRQLGHTLHCITESTVFHLEGQSPGRPTHEKHNATILAERCKDLFQPDLHRHGLRDGFRIVINDLLNTSLLLPEEHDLRLQRESSGKSLAAMFETVQENPHWLTGHEQLADALQDAGAYAQAAAIRARIVKFLPNLAQAEKLHITATQANDTGLADFGLHISGSIKKKQSDRHKYEASIKYFLGQADKYNDKFLADLYLEKLNDWKRK